GTVLGGLVRRRDARLPAGAHRRLGRAGQAGPGPVDGSREVRAVVIHAPGDLEGTTVPDPTPGAREVVVEVAACGICGTDLHILEGRSARSLPIVPGHEFAGTVVALGGAVDELAVG